MGEEETGREGGRVVVLGGELFIYRERVGGSARVTWQAKWSPRRTAVYYV